MLNNRLVIQTFLGTRGLLAVVACVAMLVCGRSAADVLANWDVQHYFAIAEKGYTDLTQMAFFPGWPLLLKAISLTGIPMLVAGCILALLCSAAATEALRRLGGPAAAIAWLLAPTAVFTIVPYTESLFCAAAFWAWERASNRHWLQAALLAAVAASVRVSGLFLIGALAILLLTGNPTTRKAGSRSSRLRNSTTRTSGSGNSVSRNFGSRTSGARTSANSQRDSFIVRVKRLGWLLIPVAVIATYATYLYSRTGSWMAWFNAQSSGWVREFTLPWVSFMNTLDPMTPGHYPEHPEWQWVFTAEMISMLVGLLITIVCLIRKRLAEGAWVGIQVFAFSISYWFFSVNRAVLLWFPLWTQLGELLTHNSKRIALKAATITFVVAAALAIQLAWAWLFYTGQWAS